MTRVIIVRHGETDWNKVGRYQGHEPTQLNASGRAQAQATDVALQKIKFDAVYSSDLPRAYQTVQIITNLPIHMDSRLREPHYGVFQGLTYAEMQAQYPTEFAAWYPERKIAPPDGETPEQIANRAASFLEDMQLLKNKTVLVVSHGELIQVLLCLCLKEPLANQKAYIVDNVSITEIAHSDGEWHLLRFNDTTHLS